MKRVIFAITVSVASLLLSAVSTCATGPARHSGAARSAARTNIQSDAVCRLEPDRPERHRRRGEEVSGEAAIYMGIATRRCTTRSSPSRAVIDRTR